MRRLIAYPAMVLSAWGIATCVILYALSLGGNSALPKRAAAVVFPGLFVVWLPTVLLMNGLTRDFKQKDLWKAALRGCPPWMRIALWVSLGTVFFLTLVLPVLSGSNPGASPGTFIIFPVCFYAVSFCVMYSVLHVEKFDAERRCVNGHRISPLAKFCEECGAPAEIDVN
jgi:hypothetical protein